MSTISSTASQSFRVFRHRRPNCAAVAAHGTNDSTLLNAQSEDEERELIGGALAAIEHSTGRRPRGWLSPGQSESHRALDLLATFGIEYVAAQIDDKQPYFMRVGSGARRSLRSSRQRDRPAPTATASHGAEQRVLSTHLNHAACALRDRSHTRGPERHAALRLTPPGAGARIEAYSIFAATRDA